MKRPKGNKGGTYAEAVLYAYGVLLIFAAIAGARFISNLEHQYKSGFTYSDYIIYVASGVLGVVLIVSAVLLGRKRIKNQEAELAEAAAERQRALDLASDQAELTAEEFLSLSEAPEFTGVYILHNETKGMYYVGQSVRVMQRVRQHLTGHGNGDVYADYKYGDRFTVRTISMASSGYLSIDDLERDMIEAYDAYDSGYNRQRGNGK